MERVAHRAGVLKQKNKLHKTGRHRSKGVIDNDQKAFRFLFNNRKRRCKQRKVSVKTITRRHKQLVRKDQRRNQAQQIRKNKRDEVLAKKRSLGGNDTAPFLVCILPLNEQVDPRSALSILENCDPTVVVARSASGVTHITIPRFKQRFSFVVPPVGRGNEFTALDCLKVCDTTMLLISANTNEDDLFDKWGKRVLNMAMAQGIPTPIVSLMDLESIAPKRKQQVKTNIQKFIAKSFPNEKLMCLDTNGDALNHFRRIGGQKKNTLHNKANRPHLYAESVNFVPNAADESTGTLEVTGFLRGVPLNVNNLVHIPGLGDFQMNRIDAPLDVYRMEKNRNDSPMYDSETRILAKADPTKQVSLERENIPDAMDAEQTFPTDEEIAMAREETKKSKIIKRVPKGMSDYQACWIPDMEEVDNSDGGDDDDDDDADDDEMESDNDNDENFMSCESEPDSDAEFEKNDADEEFDTVTVSEAPVNDDKYDLDMDLQEERETWDKIKQARVDQQWPDEIDTPLDIPARTRFQRFRGLESFRTSPWDVKENLPIDYARIYQFKNFDRIKRRLIKEATEVDGAEPGWYITVHVANVSQVLWRSWLTAQSDKHVILYGLLPHEHKMCVVNAVLKRSPDSTIPIKSKEKLIVQCGFRRFIVNPIYSAHTNGDKHKYERFFRENETVVATFYAPIQFPPSPVLCFQQQPDTTLKLVANGVLMSCNPDRVVLKRIVLSGHPFKINRKTATIRYMFFNKEDVEYFKPIKLRTRCGRLGHIKESLGTHGHMKCVFDGQLKSFDSVFLYLYKRVFPKWQYEDCIVSCSIDGVSDAVMA